MSYPEHESSQALREVPTPVFGSSARAPTSTHSHTVR